MIRQWLKKSIPACFAGFYAFSTLVVADDTEIYFGSSSAVSGTTINPNILLVLDTSSSMTADVSGTGMNRLDNMKVALRTLISNTNNVNMGLMRFSRAGGPVLYPVRNIDEELDTGSAGEVTATISQSDDDAVQSSLGVMSFTDLSLKMTEVAAGGSTTKTYQVSSGDDDAEEKVSNGSMYLTSTDLELMHDGGDLQLVGVRFTGVDIDKTAVIETAIIEFTDDNEGKDDANEAVEISIAAELGGDTGTFGTGSGENTVSGRMKTSAVSWVPGTFSSDKLTTANLATQVTEVINHANWTKGDPITFMMERTSGTGLRVVQTYNKNPSKAPVLKITYNSGGAGATNQTVGLRFQEVGIPKGVTIDSAVLEFSAATTGSAATSLTITAESTGNAEEFKDQSNNLSVATRPRTTASVAWAPSSWDTVGGTEQSATVKTILQELVNHADWCGNNSMAFFITGTGLRNAESFDSNPSLAPSLKVTYDPDSVPASGGCFNQSYSYRVSNGTDDAEEKSGEQAYLNSSDLELVEDSGTQKVGIRFNSVQIANSAEIQNAYIEFVADESDSEATSLTFYGHDVDNAPTFGATSDKVISRFSSKTTASVAWNSIDPWSIGFTYRSPDLTSIVQEIVNRPGWTPGNGMAFLIEGSGKRVAFSNDGESGLAPRLVVQAKSDLSEGAVQTTRTKLLQIVDEIQYKSGTPIVGSYYEAALYFRGEDVDFGKQRGNSGSSRREHTRVSHEDSYTGGTVVRDASCTDDNLSSTACISETITGSATYVTPIVDSCQSNHIVILTDGAASYNDAESKVKTMVGTSTCIQGGNQACGPELATFLHTEDQNDDLDNAQTITTHTIGFNFTGDWIKSLSTNGGGGFYEADTADELIAAFDAIVVEALKTSSTFAAPGVAINQFSRLNNRDEVYFAIFKPEDSAYWPGNMKKFKFAGEDNTIVDANNEAAVNLETGFFKDTSKSFWSSVVDGSNVELGGAAENLPDYDAPRKVYTYTGVSDNLTNDVNAVHEVVTDEYNALITKTLLGDAAMSDVDRENIIDWIRGKDVNDDYPDTDTRPEMGDPLHSRPVILTHGGTEESPQSTLLFGTNDGKIRAINTDNGQQRWAYIPPELLSISKTLYENTSSAHPYGVDGAPTLWVNDPDFDGESIDLTGDDNHAYVYFGMRRGGRNYHALDVTDINTPKVLWTITGGNGDFVELGQSWSRPIKSKIELLVSGNAVTKDVLIFAGGYDPNQDTVSVRTPDSMGRALYIVDATTGALIWSGGPTDTFTKEFDDMLYSMPASPSVVDINLDGFADQIYIGDMGGQVWRFDIFNGTTAANLIDGGVVASLSAASDAANTRRFYHSPDLAILEDESGSAYLGLSIGSGYHAHPLDETVTDRFYLIKVPSPFAAPGSYTAVTESDLFDATDNTIQAGGEGAETAVAELEAASGWMLTLPNPGEKVLSTPLTITGNVIFTTYEPESQAAGCQVQPGTSREYVLRAVDATATLDLNASGDIDGNDRSRALSSGSIIDQPIVVFTEDGGPSLLLGVEPGDDIGISQGVEQTFWYQQE